VITEQPSTSLDGLLHGAGQHLRAPHRLLRQRQPSPLDALLEHSTGVPTIKQGAMRPWAELLIRAYWACGGQTDTCTARRALELVVASFVASMSALEIFDDLVDGDEPVGGRQAPNLALALLGESTGLLARLPSTRVASILACWGDSWARCAAAQAQDVACATERNLTVEQAVVVAEGSGAFTRWAVEAGAVMAGAGTHLRAPLVAFGRHLGTAEKLLHDIHDLWPGPHPSHDLHRPSCSLALAVARQHNLVTSAPCMESDDAMPRRQLLECGALHYAWAYADWYRLQAGDALERFAQAGGDPALLIPVLALPDEVRAVRVEEADRARSFSCGASP
jgi:geranylgeranyl pyrophosphate synthase